MNTTTRTSLSTVTAAGAGLLLAATAVVLAPAASAAPRDAGPTAVDVSTAAPAEIGLGGLPVAFTSTAKNVGPYDTSYARLIYRIDGGAGLPPDAVSLQYRLSGTAWKTVPLTRTGTEFSGELPEQFPLAVGASRTVQLRLGLPMGTTHHGDSNGGTDHLKLTTLAGYGASGAATGRDDDTVRVDGLSSDLSGVPATATAGGPAVTFRATVHNPTASAYENVTDVLFTNRHTTVQVLRSGTWRTLSPITSTAEPDVYGFDIVGKDVSMAAHSSTTAQVRLTYRKDAPAGKTTVHPCAIVNEGSLPFRGITSCGAFATLTVKAAGSGTSTPTPAPSHSPTASAPAPTGTATATPTTTSTATAGQLARTGSSGLSATAGAAAGLFAAGAAAVGFTALRRRRGNRA